MIVSVHELQTWMDAKEDGHLEFKEAKTQFDFERLLKYCVAFANEGGGRLILGVTDKRPRTVVGSRAFRDLERTKATLTERLQLRLDVEEIPHPDGRVMCLDQRRNAGSSDRASCLCSTMSGGLSTSAMTGSTFSKVSLLRTCPLSMSAWFARPP